MLEHEHLIIIVVQIHRRMENTRWESKGWCGEQLYTEIFGRMPKSELSTFAGTSYFTFVRCYGRTNVWTAWRRCRCGKSLHEHAQWKGWRHEKSLLFPISGMQLSIYWNSFHHIQRKIWLKLIGIVFFGLVASPVHFNATTAYYNWTTGRSTIRGTVYCKGGKFFLF